ncbi:ubiquitin carboxyl-terminal hydrolase [Encephalitozoon hellem]|uniref:Ubiquitin carboxyl-terminal hydrolase n=2 Tax=Encephalitozoon hellem TaxID=27973 RepID=A0A9Q9C335_ENCHE|nr:ubiquitin carboxyl-terminal hydrolase [Encephalitozoon hellem]
MDLCAHFEALRNVEKIHKMIISKLDYLRKRGVRPRCQECKAAANLRLCMQCYCFLCDMDEKLHQHSMFLDLFYTSISCILCAKRYLPSTITARAGGTVLVKIPGSLYEILPHVPIKGFSNLGNTCYINAVLSIMINSILIRSEFLLDTHKRCSENRCIVCAMRFLIDSSYRSGCILTHRFIHTFWSLAPHLSGPGQQDAHEFFMCLLQKIHEVYSTNVADDLECKCLSHRMFFGVFTSKTICKMCNLEREKEELFATISLECLSSIQSSLNTFFEPEDLRCGMACEACREKVSCTRRLEVKRCPNILSLHLKRFSYDKASRKVDSYVALSNTLIVGKGVYDILGFVSHYGSIDHGHYFSHVILGDKWYKIDDEKIDFVPYPELSTDGLYIAYYLKRGK